MEEVRQGPLIPMRRSEREFGRPGGDLGRAELVKIFRFWLVAGTGTGVGGGLLCAMVMDGVSAVGFVLGFGIGAAILVIVAPNVEWPRHRSWKAVLASVAGPLSLLVLGALAMVGLASWLLHAINC